MSTVSHRSPWEVSRQDFPSILPVQTQLTFLLQYAILAPSSKNTQPWKFSVGGNTVGVFADMTRWQPVADRDRRELYISLGCALENLLLAAAQFGFRCEVHPFPQPGNEELVATVAFYPAESGGRRRGGPSLHTLTARRTERSLFRDLRIAPEYRRRLEYAVADLGVRLDLTDESAIRAEVLALNLQADEMEFDDPAFRQELGHWMSRGMRKSRLLSRAAGVLVPHLNIGRLAAKRNAALLSSAPLIGLISSASDDRISQLRVGRALERVWLHATDMGLGLQPLSQALEIPSLRGRLAEILPGNRWIPQQLFRLGFTRQRTTKHTSRLSVDEVLLG
jgi:hypothetical protein